MKAFEIVTLGMLACASQAEACDIMSAMSSCAALGNIVMLLDKRLRPGHIGRVCLGC